VLLSSQEFDFLYFLYRNRDRVLTRSHLVEKIWGYDFDGDERVVDTTVKRLRRKIGSETVETVRGRGYRFSSQ
jgi:DNA-binding response OmpR family regulator